MLEGHFSNVPLIMVARQLPPPLPRPASRPTTADSAGSQEEQGPLWDTIKRQLYKAEVSHVRRLVGESLIQQNKVMWAEAASLRQILADFEQQNDELSDGMKQQVQLCGTQHRDLLRRQAQIIMEDVRAQASQCGHVLEDLVPEFKNENLRDYVIGKEQRGREQKDAFGCKPTPPMTPSTRPPSSCGGVSGCSTPDVGLPPLPLGRHLGVDELDAVAEGIREALQAEQESLLTAIGEQMQRFDAEESRRVSTKAGAAREPSTTELQQLVHKLQDLVVSPGLRTLSVTGPSSPGAADSFDATDAGLLNPAPIVGGANVRRLKALIAQRRRGPVFPLLPLGAVPEANTGAELAPPASGAPTKAGFDPFFDDPFA